MFCDRCGANLTPASRFCPTCGKSFAPVAQPQAPEYRVSRHVRNLGILWMVYSAIHLIPGLILQSMPHWLPFRYDYPFFLGGIFRAIGAMLMLKGVLGLIAGWGLLDRQPWARMLAIVLGFLSLIHMPFGTAIGIYTLWVLLPGPSAQEYDQLAQP